MDITIVGASGSVGRHVVEQALAADHHVTAVTRHSENIRLQHPRLTVAEGNPAEPEVARAAVTGRDAVIVVLGAGRKGVVREAATRTVVRAMEQSGVRRLVCQSTIGAGDSRGNLSPTWKYLMFGLLLRAVYLDHQRQEAVVRDSGLDWTIVRPGSFTDGPRTGDYRHGFDGTDRTIRMKVSRADVADFLLRQVSSEQYRRRAVALSY